MKKIEVAVILGAGFGKRLTPITNEIPKPLVEIGNETILEKTIKLVKKLNLKIGIIHFDSELIDVIPKRNQIILSPKSDINEASKNSANHRYPSYAGMMSFRDEGATWYKNRFNVAVEGAKNVIILIGSKEGVAHAPLAFINPGDIGLVPYHGYPVYSIATTFAPISSNITAVENPMPLAAPATMTNLSSRPSPNILTIIKVFHT